jgi:glycosyltransferase involved in cell wall biosynthesis
LNVPDPKRFPSRNDRRCGRSPSARFNVVYHGTITRRLGIDLALQAISRLKKTITELQFFVFGTGDDLNEFAALRNSLGLKSTVHFNGKMLPVDKLVKELTIMDLGLIANRKNIATDLMLPVKMLEYFALGIPVVAPRLKTIAHYCDDGMVAFYDPERIDSMVQAIHTLYSDPARRRRQVARAGQFLDQYGWDRHKSELVAVYQF